MAESHHRGIVVLSRSVLLAVAFVLSSAALDLSRVRAQTLLDSNVTYGMYSGLALLMDVVYPERSNGHAIVYIGGSGWHLPEGYAGQGQKDRRYAPDVAFLPDAGYTVFYVNHRTAPRFRYPSALEDVQRAVRFIRYNAKRFNIDPQRIGVWGFSSGAHLAALLGVLEGNGNPDDADPTNRISAKVQCVVAGALPADLTAADGRLATVVASFLGSPNFSLGPLLEDKRTIGLARDASPIFHVTPDDAPFLLEHGDADEVVPFSQSVAMEKALREAGVEVALRRVEGGDHGGPKFAAQDRTTRYAAIRGWYDRHLRGPRSGLEPQAGFVGSPRHDP